MRLATFMAHDSERFGIVLRHPLHDADWVFDPAATAARLALYASRPTSPLSVSLPRFFEGKFPTSLVAFLELHPDGIDRLRRLRDFLIRFLEQADTYILLGAGFPLAEVKLLAPIPRPRLFFGLVQNSPTVWRNRTKRTHLNLFPQGHQRPLGSVLGPDEPIVLPHAELITGGWNPELGVIIGRGGRDIAVEDAMSHVAGLTIVSDVTFDYYRRLYESQTPPLDWYEDATTSWGDKKSDARAPIGPYLVTLDEVGNPYDLLIYTRQAGYLRDRSHTGAMALSIERTISWLSSFRALHSGDVIHMGTMGYDGSPYVRDAAHQGGDYIESEIERLGVLRNPLVIAPTPSEVQAARQREHPSPVARDLLAKRQSSVTRERWRPELTNHLWIVFGNYDGALQQEDMQQRDYPRFLCAPNTALTGQDARVRLPPRARELWFSCELSCVIRDVTRHVTREQASDHILGYVPMAAIHDMSFAESIIEPASMQERHLPGVYARWGDGFNVVGMPVTAPDTTNLPCRLTVDGIGSTEGTTQEYRHDATDVIAFISQHITLFPGDVISLGRLASRLWIDATRALPNGTRCHAEIKGIGSVAFTLIDERDNAQVDG